MGNLNLQKICGPEYDATSDMNTRNDGVIKVKDKRHTPRNNSITNGMQQEVLKPQKPPINENMQKLVDAIKRTGNRMILRHYSQKWIRAYMAHYLNSNTP